MGGSGSGGSYSGSAEELARTRAEVRDKLRQQQLAADVNQFLAEELAEYNARDSEGTREKLDSIEEELVAEGYDVERLGFGGSVAKHTYIDGLSDVDVLVFLDASYGGTPSEVIEGFADVLRETLPASAEVTTGNMAVTVTYRDGTQIQLLPATERGDRTVIPSPDGNRWKAVRPHKFAEKLTETNRRNGGGVVPVIKLAKSLVDRFPAAQQLSGYHMEALAVDAFRSYDGPRDRASMLHHLLGHAARAVLRPSVDITGQSLHIDDQLGGADSSARRAVSGALARTAATLRTATSPEDYRQAFE